MLSLVVAVAVSCYLRNQLITPLIEAEFLLVVLALVGMPEGKRPVGRPRRRWVDNIKTDLREIGWDGMDWIDLGQNRDQ
jgi:hypothetical protein